MTKAADTRGTVPTASVVASGAQRESLIPVADGDAVLVLSGCRHRSTGSQPLRCKQRGCIDHSHFSPTNAAKAIPANMMMTSGQSISSRPCFPSLFICGVRRCGFSQVRFYSLPACPETHSKYRLRKAVRAALQGFVATIADWRQREVES